MWIWRPLCWSTELESLGVLETTCQASTPSLVCLLEKAMAPHSSTVAWKIPWMKEPGRLQSVGLWRVRHNWATSLSLFIFIHWRRKWQPTPVFLPGESQGRGSLVGSVRHNWSNLAAVCLFFSSVQSLSRVRLCDPMDCSTPGLPVHHQLPEFTQTHVHWVSDAIQPSHPLSSPSPPALNLSQHQGLFQWVSSSHQVAKVLEFQLQHQFFQWIFRTDFL